MLYLGTKSRIDRDVLATAGVPHRLLSVGAVRDQSLPHLAWSLLRQLAAVVQSLAIVGRFRPQVALVTGGYASVPVAVAAWLRRVPLVLYLPDARPGLAVRALAPLAKRIAVSSEISNRYLPRSRTVVTGYPVRPEFDGAAERRDEAREAFELSAALPVVLVLGGSRGAHSLNVAVADVLEALLHHCQVIHLCGDSDHARLRALRGALDPELRSRYRVFRFLYRGVADAMAASDLAICRSGASTLGELPAAGLPAILVPLPIPGVQQEENADILVERGAAVKLPDHELQRGALLPRVIELLDDAPRLRTMTTAMRGLARTEAAENLAALLRSFAKSGGAR